jgi:hypothetical protein
MSWMSICLPVRGVLLSLLVCIGLKSSPKRRRKKEKKRKKEKQKEKQSSAKEPLVCRAAKKEKKTRIPRWFPTGEKQHKRTKAVGWK